MTNMWCLTLNLLFVTTLGVTASNEPQWTDVQNAMFQERIVSDVIPIAPKDFIEISYPSGVSVELGNILGPLFVKDRPKIKWDGADPNSLYTLCSVDPDFPMPSDPIKSEWRHWLVINIPGGDFDDGETVTGYIGSAPPPETGFHRQVFLIYKQPSNLTVDEPRSTFQEADYREHFSIHKFATKYRLGTPVAGNFFVAQYDSYVPILHRLIGSYT